ncbi:hypothetical protein [Alkalihalobacterium alkalinitrilicum]|uniref:hypothetical protein n=1 Tax=Alkalihalobacterium alkalinitrilicum TaxID=427920 RepID=UPI0009950B70|nr:hypothetical protein [Alkalihalobacterium alkalinitrilicum]
MKSAILTFVLTFGIAFGGGYLFFQDSSGTDTQQSTDIEQADADVEEVAEEMPLTVDSMAEATAGYDRQSKRRTA